MRFPTLFVNHGGGPLPLLGQQPDLVKNWEATRARLDREYGKPNAIVVLSAHWESDPIKITSSSNPGMLYDYYGFPDESYQIKYPAPGDPDLASRIRQLLLKGSSEVPALASCQLDPDRGFDHGVFVPLKVLYPEADIPVVAVSLHPSLAPDVHMAIGRAIAPLRDDGILILGSGLTYHNMEKLMRPTAQSHRMAGEFNRWLKDKLLRSEDELPSRWDDLKKWATLAPGARLAHPREDHLIPLFVAAAAAAGPNYVAEAVHEGHAIFDRHDITGFLFC